MKKFGNIFDVYQYLFIVVQKDFSPNTASYLSSVSLNARVCVSHEYLFMGVFFNILRN